MSSLVVSTEIPTEIHLTRTFDAPRNLVMKAMTTPALIKKWLGGVRADVISVDMDVRPGGRYRYEFAVKGGGPRFAFVGTIREIGPDRVVQTESMEGMPGESINTTTYEEKDGRTIMKVVMVFPSKEMRDQVVATGMSDGAGESYDELAKLLKSL